MVDVLSVGDHTADNALQKELEYVVNLLKGALDATTAHQSGGGATRTHVARHAASSCPTVGHHAYAAHQSASAPLSCLSGQTQIQTAVTAIGTEHSAWHAPGHAAVPLTKSLLSNPEQ